MHKSFYITLIFKYYVEKLCINNLYGVTRKSFLYTYYQEGKRGKCKGRKLWGKRIISPNVSPLFKDGEQKQADF